MAGAKSSPRPACGMPAPCSGGRFESLTEILVRPMDDIARLRALLALAVFATGHLAGHNMRNPLLTAALRGLGLYLRHGREESVRTATIFAALTAFLATGSLRAQSVDPLWLKCSGTWERGKGDMSFSTTIFVNFTKRTVMGPGFEFTSGGGRLGEITGLNDTKIHFSGTRTFASDWTMAIEGEIDRATGDMRAVENLRKSRELSSQTATYSLKCMPTQPLARRLGPCTMTVGPSPPVICD